MRLLLCGKKKMLRSGRFYANCLLFWVYFRPFFEKISHLARLKTGQDECEFFSLSYSTQGIAFWGSSLFWLLWLHKNQPKCGFGTKNFQKSKLEGPSNKTKWITMYRNCMQGVKNSSTWVWIFFTPQFLAWNCRDFADEVKIWK